MEIYGEIPFSLQNLDKQFNQKPSIMETKLTTLNGKHPVRSKTSREHFTLEIFRKLRLP
jgi:hypothetical protein